MVSLALEKRLFLNVPGSAYWCHLSAKSFAISTNGTIRSELSRLLISQNLLPKGGTTGHFRDALRSKRFFGQVAPRRYVCIGEFRRAIAIEPLEWAGWTRLGV